eukprot:TRINITY_DN61348_c0_g1_i1.p1 TRINITY_DN61348_c0_g1~~TRINITY_DN61348_c0_g1_i1.p1  ORF type:complete len:103 (-),score=23.58 TRINITY_DN61348_c0_g1_i1:71-379(-)
MCIRDSVRTDAALPTSGVSSSSTPPAAHEPFPRRHPRQVRPARDPSVLQQRLEREGLHLSLIHISEPTRLLSISYAVFCLKKKKKEIARSVCKETRQSKYKN